MLFMGIPTVLGRIVSSQEHEVNPDIAENQYFAVSQCPAAYDVTSCSHIMRSAVARVVGLLHTTVGSNVQREEQHPKNHIGVTI